MQTHQELLKKWLENRPSYKTFVNDGILNQRLYENSNPKILFLLKESNSSFSEIAPLPENIEGYGPNGASNTFWRYMRGYTEVIKIVWNNIEFDLDLINQKKELPNNEIAYVNLKKNCENLPVSNDADILFYAIEDREFIIEQIKIINPQIIYCAGTFKFFKEIESSSLVEVSKNLYDYNGVLVLDYLHPSHRKGYKTFQELFDLMNTSDLKNWITQNH